MNMHLSAVIPCAGLSSRMDSLKPLLKLGGLPILAHVIETIKSIDPDEILVVVGHRAEALEPIIAKAGAKVVLNPQFAQGMYSSVRCGVKHVSDNCDAFFFLPADIPLVRPATIRRLAEAYRLNPGRIVYPVFSGQRGHPPAIPADVMPAILESNGDGGLRAVLACNDHRALDVPVADENILFDLDRPEDYTKALQRFPRLSDPSPAECEAILSEVHPPNDGVVRHGRQVQRTAVAICRAMNKAGAGLDEHRVAAAGLMHDIAKGSRDHAFVGGRILKSMGFEHVAKLVAAHTDLPPSDQRIVGEAAIVYLADKLTDADRSISLESRFERSFRRFGRDPEARSAIEKRRDIAFSLKRQIEKFTGQPLLQML